MKQTDRQQVLATMRKVVELEHQVHDLWADLERWLQTADKDAVREFNHELRLAHGDVNERRAVAMVNGGSR
jgi:hypothetical protein